MRQFSAAALAASASVWLSGCGGGAEAQGPPPPAAVSVAAPLQETVTDWDEFTGRFEAVEQVDVRARTGGYLQAAHFRDGQVVKKGQLMFTLDPRPAQAALAAAQARAEAARTALARAQSLLAAEAISKEELETRKADALVAEADVRARRLDVEFTRVTAPISGVASQRMVDPGNVIAGGNSGGDVLTTIVSTSPIHFVFDASETQLLKYQRQTAGRGGAPVQVRLQDETEPRWSGAVDFQDNAVDGASGSTRLRAVIANPHGFLKPGMFGSARMQATAGYQALLIPETAITSDGPRRVAFVVAQNGEVQARALELGSAQGGYRVIRGGLKPEDRVIVNGVQRARPGQKVQAKTVTLTRDAAPATAG